MHNIPGTYFHRWEISSSVCPGVVEEARKSLLVNRLGTASSFYLVNVNQYKSSDNYLSLFLDLKVLYGIFLFLLVLAQIWQDKKLNK